MEIYSSMKKNPVIFQPHRWTWKDILSSKVSQTQKWKYQASSTIWRSLKVNSTEQESRIVFTRSWGRGEGRLQAGKTMGTKLQLDSRNMFQCSTSDSSYNL